MDRRRTTVELLDFRILLYPEFLYRSHSKLFEKGIFKIIKYKIPIDTLTFDFAVMDLKDPSVDLNKAPTDGCYTWGLFLDGCKWN